METPHQQMSSAHSPIMAEINHHNDMNDHIDHVRKLSSPGQNQYHLHQHIQQQQSQQHHQQLQHKSSVNHQESMMTQQIDEQTSFTGPSVTKYSLLQFAMQHFRNE